MAIPKATPTEYKGIVYRSKSEAMFARWLELSACIIPHPGSTPRFKPPNVCSDDGCGWAYEPEGFSVGDWKPDFLHWRISSFAKYDFGLAQIPVLCYDLIEYKPSRPTDTYARGFAQKVMEIDERLSVRDDFTCRVSYSIFYGSIFNADRGTVTASPFGDGTVQHWFETVNWLAGYEDAIRNTRFDLEAR